MNPVKIIRTQLGWSQQRLADELGLTSRHIQRLESGERLLEPQTQLALLALQDGHRITNAHSLSV
jgi:transcriptional regulator with XRE-family HTH domain